MYFNNGPQNYQSFPPNQYQNSGYFQQQTQQIQPVYNSPRQGLQFKTINTPDEIVPGDVPMDGSMAFFVMNDHSGIFGKWWDRSGTLQTVKYVRDDSASVNPKSNDISDRLDRIESQLNNLNQMIHRNNYKKGRMNYGDQRKSVDGTTSSNRPSDG